MSAKITKRYLDYNGLQYLIEKIKKGIPFILKPTLTNQYDLGQTDKQWKNIYGENVYQNQKQVVDTIKMNGTTTALTNTNGTVVIPIVAGPQGPTGEQGPVGTPAGFGTPTATTTIIADNADPTVSVTASGSNTDKVFAFTFGLPKGYQGATGLQGDQGVQGATGPRGVQGATGGAGFIASVDRQNFTKANWETYGTVGHQENWSNTTIPAGMIPGDLFVVTGCATDTGDGYQLVYKYDPTFQPTNTTLRGTCISSHIIARHAQLGTANAGTNISITNNKINADGYVYDADKGSFAEGNMAHASGNMSHAEGNATIASAEASHAEGYETVASGDYSHAEGSQTLASGEASHAEGNATIAKNQFEHASGDYNKSTQAATGATGTAANAYSIFSVGIGTSDTDRRNAIEVHRNGDVFINGTCGVAAGNMNYSKSFQTLFNSLTNDIYNLKRFGGTDDTFSQDTLLWKPNVTYIGQEGFYINATTCAGSQVKLVLPDNETYNGSNFTNFDEDDMVVFSLRFQYYALYNASGHEITLTLYSNDHSIITKDNVTSFTLAAGGLIEFCATMQFGSMAFEDVYGENGIYIVTYTQYF